MGKHLRSILFFNTPLKSLKEIPDHFKKIVIRKDNSITYTDDDDGILHLNLFDFLLDRISLE